MVARKEAGSPRSPKQCKKYPPLSHIDLEHPSIVIYRKEIFGNGLMIIVYQLLFKCQFLKLAHRLEIGRLYSREGIKGTGSRLGRRNGGAEGERFGKVIWGGH